MPKDFQNIIIANLKGIYQVMANVANGIDDDNATLNFEETSIFNKIRANNKNAEQNGYFEYDGMYYNEDGESSKGVPIISRYMKETVPAVSTNIVGQKQLDEMEAERIANLNHNIEIEKADKVPIEKTKEECLNEITNMINELSEVNADTEYWSNTIYEISTKYGIAPEVLVNIVAIETGRTFPTGYFRKGGVTQITPIAAKDLIVRTDSLYKLKNEKLVNDTIYTEAGKKRSPENIRQECNKNPRFALMVGVLIFSAFYEAPQIPENATPEEIKALNKKALITALGKYNVGNRAKYMQLSKEYLERLGYDYSQPPLYPPKA